MRIRASIVAAALLASSPTALAGDDPWVIGKGDVAVYAGLGGTSWSSFSDGNGSLSGSDSAIANRVVTTLAQGAAEYGVIPRGSLEARAAGGFSQVTDAQSKSCGGTACQTQIGATPIDVRFRYRLLNEVMGAPVSVTVGPVLRVGAHTRAARDQLTSMGDGQNDVGVHASVGRMGFVGPMLVAAYGAVRYSHRVLTDAVDDVDVPRHELAGLGELSVQTGPRLSLGLAVDALHRPDGVDWGDSVASSEARFAALSITTVKAGAKVGVLLRPGLRLHASVVGTAYARNNPNDAWSAGLGLGWYRAAPQDLSP